MMRMDHTQSRRVVGDGRPRGPALKHVIRRAAAVLVLTLATGLARAEEATPTWPPALPGAKNGTVTLKTDLFLQVPQAVEEQRKKDGAAPFIMAKTPPTIDLAYHGSLPNEARNGTGWSAWGDIGVASDGKVYSGTGDHGDDAGGNSYCFIYQWDPATKTLKQVVDMNQVVPRKPGQPTWSKVHARIDEGPDGKIYFCCTLNDGNAATDPRYKWTKDLPGGQLYQFDPKTEKTIAFANLPPARCTATSLLDRKRNIWWCNLEAGPNALFALDLKTKEVLYQAPAGSMVSNRNFALAKDGTVYFNGKGGTWRCDAQARSITPVGVAIGMRSSTRESIDGHIYGVAGGKLFRFTPATRELRQLGSEFLTGNYTTVCVLSPDERFLYYMPGAHGGAKDIGTPAVQYEIKTGQRKVIAFVREPFEKKYAYVPAGSYGVKMSADGSTLYVNFNGSQAPPRQQPGFGLTSFAAIHIPKSER